MRTHGWIAATAVVVGCAGWFGRSVLADDPPKGGAPGGMEEMMKMMGTPGEQHARLIKALEGDWTVHAKMHEMDGTVTESDGTSTFKGILGGRFVTQELHATMKGKPFEGRGVMGYDNASKQFVQNWIDEMGTGFFTGTGQETQPGKAWGFKSSMNTPMGPMNSREELKVTGDKTLTYTMFMAFGPGAPESPVFEAAYTRK